MHRLVPVPLLLLLLACLLDIFQAVPAGRATRSTPSAVVRVVTLDPNPPAPPADVAATGSSAGTDLTVTWRATAPDGPAGRFWFEVLDPAGPFNPAPARGHSSAEPGRAYSVLGDGARPRGGN
jgi:hypothetical protein